MDSNLTQKEEKSVNLKMSGLAIPQTDKLPFAVVAFSRAKPRKTGLVTTILAPEPGYGPLHLWLVTTLFCAEQRNDHCFRDEVRKVGFVMRNNHILRGLFVSS
jgi:hypothetical protein